MTHPLLPLTPQEAIAAALDHYWITTDPTGPFNTTEAAAQISAHLDDYGYTVTTIPAAAMSAAAAYATANHCTCPPPSRASVAVTALLALACVIGCLASFLRGEQGWAFAAIVGASALANETTTDLRIRRAAR